jgi:hypothetical protein
MKGSQKYLLSGLVVSTVGVTTYLLKDKPKRDKTKETVQKWMTKIKSPFLEKEQELPIDKAGKPDPEDVDDTKMVSEGAMTGVQYYNEKQQ